MKGQKRILSFVAKSSAERAHANETMPRSRAGRYHGKHSEKKSNVRDFSKKLPLTYRLCPITFLLHVSAHACCRFSLHVNSLQRKDIYKVAAPCSEHGYSRICMDRYSPK